MINFGFPSKDKASENKARHSCRVPLRAVHPVLLNHSWEHRWVCAAEVNRAVATAEGPTPKVSSSS